MRHSWKKGLKAAFEAPAPLGKKEFLYKLTPPRVSVMEFAFAQAAYIRRWSRCASVLVFAVSLTGAVVFSVDMVWAISALAPLMALALVSECSRSERYEMEELEMVTRFSLRSVVLARLGVLGMENLAAFCLLLPIGMRNNELGILQAGTYIIVPFLLTTFLSLCVTRRFRGQEGTYIGVTIAVCVSITAFYTHMRVPALYGKDCLVWWVIGMLLLGAGTVGQYKYMIKRTEELA